MAKELIVSVNGREKKIAIIENERVTEFYIERGEEDQGIVGNIYKGRVMRVLPGMQSAFVDIGLERDAFLYVSDFFDEEEEFERIVMDKSKKGEATSVAERAAQERIEQARIEREQRIEATQERAEPLRDVDASDVLSIIGDEGAALEGISPFVEALEEASDEAEEPLMLETNEPTPAKTAPLSSTQETIGSEGEAGGGRRRGRRGRRRGKGAGQSLPGETQEETFAREEQERAGSETVLHEVEEIETPFIAGASDFQRVVDDDETAAENGAMFKDARVQERILDHIHAVEFDMEDVPTAEVGSLLSSGVSSGGGFQRIDDSDVAAADNQETSFVQQTVAAHVGAFVDEINEETVGAQSFERISDDEGGAETTPATASASTTTAATGGKRGARGAASSSSRRGAKKTATVEEAREAETEEVTAEPLKPKRASSKKAAKTTAVAKSASKKAASKGKPTTTKGRSRRASSTGPGETDIAVLEGEAGRAEHADAVASKAADGEHYEAGKAGEDYDDATASMKSGRSRAEFATRRGGRRRNKRPTGKPAEGGDGGDRTNGKDHEAVAAAVEVEEVHAPAPAPPARVPSGRDRSSDRGGRSERPSNGRDGGGREGGRESGGGREGGGRGGSRHDRDRRQPTITDLLREGQEILVQIAKEPIAKKGARITSHIALPGRFLVYMPTVEHVGVSRKIESDSERVRLRKLIQLIRTEEDVPSGGFIVRTAGVGISEEDLREDARYLVRTWLDIRRTAERAKAPALAHADLDLVQRILRDQLSDDFTAIRVDSEEEYLSIVEFINRIQPRMVKRVKLYTRDEPILEAFGVQPEIDKAIKPRVWLRSGGYLVINQTEALVAIDVNTGKFVGRGGTRLEDTITKTNMEAVEEIVRQIRLRDLGGIIVLDLIDMEDRRNRNRVMQALQEALQGDKSPTKVLSFNDFGLVIMTRKRVKQSLERTLCTPCPYCTGAGLVKSPQTICYEILDEARRLGKGMNGDKIKQTTLRINPEVARALRSTERDVLTEIEDYLGAVDITSDEHIHQEQFDFAFI
ncbi:MAG: ribonuclease [Blastocatellia bacterium]|jgi:ribonuclease G|nr:ribonuclease [Blastocatellia bacterium]